MHDGRNFLALLGGSGVFGDASRSDLGHQHLQLFFDLRLRDNARLDLLDDEESLVATKIFARLRLLLDVAKHTVVVLVHVHARAEQGFLEVAVTLLLGQINQLVKYLEALWLLATVFEALAQAVEITASPVEVAVVSLLEQI